ncbi:hypothetical protein K8R66_04710 [bacterium]|nr:hypothetical protein [bacterium]
MSNFEQPSIPQEDNKEEPKALIPEEEKELPDENDWKEGMKEQYLNKATSFEELKKLIDASNLSIQGSQEKFTPDMLKDVITKIQNREWALDTATSSDGFRNKVAQLLQTDNNVDSLKQILDDVRGELAKNFKIRDSLRVENPILENKIDKQKDWANRLILDIRKLKKEDNK